MDKSKEHQTDILSLSGAEFNSYMLGVFRDRAEKIKPSDILSAWEENQYCGTGKFDPVDLLTLQRAALEASQRFEAVEISPVCPLGTVSVLAPIHQNNVVSSIRGTEVVSDSTNVLALESAVRRKRLLRENPANVSDIKLSCSHRLLRGQKFNQPGFYQHFRIFCLTTAGRARADHAFECETLIEHIEVYLSYFEALKNLGFRFDSYSLKLYSIDVGVRERMKPHLQCLSKLIEWTWADARPSGNGYYPSLSFHFGPKDLSGTPIFVCDGGITDWTQKLLENKKERFFISATGIEHVLKMFAPQNRA